jgi:hypothetical protein
VVVSAPIVETAIVHSPVIEPSVVCAPVVHPPVVGAPIIESAIVGAPGVHAAVVRAHIVVTLGRRDGREGRYGQRHRQDQQYHPAHHFSFVFVYASATRVQHTSPFDLYKFMDLSSRSVSQLRAISIPAGQRFSKNTKG